MLENMKIVDAQTRSKLAAGEEEVTPSYFEWNEVVFRSFQNGNVKALNYDFFLSIERSVAKRLYRFLDKRFFHSSELEFDLKTLAYEHIGLSRNSPTGDLKRKLSVAIDELEEKGYLQPIAKEKRFIKEGPGAWRIVFVRRNADMALRSNSQSTDAGAGDLVTALVQFGVREQKASDLVRRFPRELVEQKLEIAQWLKQRADSRVSSNPAGYLVSSVEDQYEPPREFKRERQAGEEKLKQRRSAEATEQRRIIASERDDARSVAKRKAIDQFLGAISHDERTRIETEALDQADAGKRKMLAICGKVGETARQTILDTHILELLANG